MRDLSPLLGWPRPLLAEPLPWPRARTGGQDTYVFFADQAKAYDSVWRAGMLHKLWAKGIRGRMYRVIANMYSSTVLCVGHQAAMSQPFTVPVTE